MSAVAGALLALVAAAPVKVALTNWSLTRVDPVSSQALELRFAERLSAQGLAAASQRDLVAALALERQRQLMGCADDDSSCLLELTGALGVDAIISGVLSREGSRYLITLRVVRASDAALIESTSGALASLAALRDFLDAAAPRLAAAIGRAFERAPAPRAAGRGLRWAVVGAGAAAAIAGGICFGLSKGEASRLSSASPAQPLTAAEAGTVARRGSALEASGLGLLIGGGVALAAGALWLALSGSGDSPPPIALWATPQGAGVSARF